MTQEQNDRRAAAESAYRSLLSRIRETPGIDVNDAFNKQGAGGERSLNQLFSEAGYGLEQRNTLMNSLLHAKRCAERIDSGELYLAERNLERFNGSIEQMRKEGLLSERQLGSMEGDAKVWAGTIEQKRPEAYAKAQTFFADTVANGAIDPESVEKNALTFYRMLRDAGLNEDRAALGYYALPDAMRAREFQRLGQSGEIVEQPLLELKQSIEFAKTSKPPFLDAGNIQRMSELENWMQGNRKTPEVSGVFVPSSILVRDEETMEKQARANVEKLQALMDWHKGKEGWHSIGGFYGSVFQQGPGNIAALNDALSGKTPGDRMDNLQKALETSDVTLNAISGKHREKSPQELVKIVDDIRETMFKNADIMADAVGVLPGIGPRAKFLIKETAIGLRYMSGDYSAAEAIGATVKESISAVLGDQRFKESVIQKYGLDKTGEEFLVALGGAIAGNVIAETGKLIGQNDLSQIGPKKIAMAIETGIAKGIVEGGFKIAEKYDLDNKTLQEFTKLMVRVAQKFGVERPVDQEIDRWLKSQNKNGKSYSLEDGGGRTDPDGPNRDIAPAKNAASTMAVSNAAVANTAAATTLPANTPAFDSALAAIARSDLPELPRQKPETDNLAAALALSMQRAGVREIDTLTLSNDGTRLIAVQGDPRASDNRVSSVVLRDALAQPAERSLETLARQEATRVADSTPTREVEASKKTAPVA